MKKDTLILGIGNLLLRDESAGIRVVYRLENEGYSDADLLDGGTGGFHLLGILQSYKKVIIVDASIDKNPAGCVRVLHPKYARDFPCQLSAHEIGLKNLIDSAFLLGSKPSIWLVAITVKNFQDLGMQLSPEVESAIPEAIAKVKELIHSFSN